MHHWGTICDTMEEAASDGADSARDWYDDDDLEARAEVVQSREPWENAMEIMRERESGCVHARIVSPSAR